LFAAAPRRWRWLAPAGAAVLGLALALACADARAQDFVSIQSAGWRAVVNVRAQPSTQSEVLWTLGYGYPLAVQERRGQWLRVRDYEGPLGWVYAPLTGTTAHVVVTVHNANLRAGPSTGHPVLGQLQHQEVVRTLGTQGQWVQVQRSDGQSGWVARKLTWGW